MTAVAIVDSGVANLGSVRAAFARLGVDAVVTRDADVLRGAARVVLPGVGAMDSGMRALRDAGLVETLQRLTQPLLGICLGMQLLYERSEEGDEPGLGLLKGTVRKLRAVEGARVPHMGWNTLRHQRASALTRGIPDGGHAYFVHSYAVDGDDAAARSVCMHGKPFAAIVGRGNVHGAQFHPERSAATGERLLRNFMEIAA